MVLEEMLHFIEVKFLCIDCSEFLLIILIPGGGDSALISLLSFLTLLSPVFSPFVHVILPRSLSVVLTFSKGSFHFH